jgi:hypothetical protein
VSGGNHLGLAGDLGGGGRGFDGIGIGHQHMHITTAGEHRGHGVQGRRLDGGVVVFSDNECGHFCIPSDHFGFVLELVHQGGHVGHLDAGAALGVLGHLQGLQTRGHIDAQVFGLEGV